MGEDALAQDEIDALLQAAAGEPAQEEKKKEPATEIADEFLNSSKEVFSSLLGEGASLKKEKSGSIPIDVLAQELADSVAVAFVTASKGLTSTAVLIFDEKKMTVVTDLILMSGGTKKEKFTEEDIDALKEAVNQIMGNLGQNLTSKYGEPIAFEQADVQILTPKDALPKIKEKLKEDSFYNVLCSLKMDDKIDMQFNFLLPLSIEKEIESFSKKLAEQKAASAKVASVAPQYKSTAITKKEDFDSKNLDLIFDLNVEVNVKLGETTRTLKEMVSLIEGNILTLDKAADAPVDVIVNNKVIAKGELMVIPPSNFAIKITQVKNRMDRIKNLKFN